MQVGLGVAMLEGQLTCRLLLWFCPSAHDFCKTRRTFQQQCPKKDLFKP